MFCRFFPALLCFGLANPIPLQAKPQVLLGVEVLARQHYKALQGKRIGLLTNHTGVDSKGRRTIDLLAKAPGVTLVRIFSPEHGLAGTVGHGEDVHDAKDFSTGIPVVSLYGPNKRPTKEMLEGLEVLVFDMQDIGTRFYTYATTMAYALEEAAAQGLEFYVLDRPNPITGSIVEGEILDPSIHHFTAYFHIPVRHGLTMGELARWHNAQKNLGAKLTVIPVKGWKRTMWWQDTGLPFTAPSPNILSPQAALLYVGVGAFEATNVSVGRGTNAPFEQFGAPWMDGAALAAKMNALGLKGARLEAVSFTPTKDVYSGQLCQGVKILVTDRNAIRPVDIFVAAAVLLKGFYPENFQPRWEEVPRVTGTTLLENMLEPKKVKKSFQTTYQNDLLSSPETWTQAILTKYRADSADFSQRRQPYLLYK